MNAKWKILWNDGSITESKTIIYFVELHNDVIPAEFQDTETTGAQELNNIIIFTNNYNLSLDMYNFFQNKQELFKSFKFGRGILSMEKFEHNE